MRVKILAAFVLVLCAAPPVRAASVRLAWDPSPSRSVVGYRIHYGVKPGKYTHTVQVKGRLTTHVVIKNLKDGKTYYFAVSAYDSKGRRSAYSSEITNRPDLNKKKAGRPAGGKAGSFSPAPAPVRSKIPPRAVRTGPEGKILPSR